MLKNIDRLIKNQMTIWILNIQYFTILARMVKLADVIIDKSPDIGIIGNIILYYPLIPLPLPRTNFICGYVKGEKCVFKRSNPPFEAENVSSKARYQAILCQDSRSNVCRHDVCPLMFHFCFSPRFFLLL